MALDIAALTAPLSDDQPSGPDLSYDNERIEIESAFERSVAEDFAGEDLDWRGTIALINDQAAKTRDLWLPVYLMRAAAQTGQFELITDAAELLASLVEERWADLHPQLDEYGFIGRKTPLESLTRLRDFLRPLTSAPLIEHPRLGRYAGADFVRFFEEGSSAENYGMFRALIEATPPEDLRQVVDRLDVLRQAIRRVDAVLTENADGDTGTNFQPTYEAIEKMRRAVASHLPAEEAGDAPAVIGADGVAGADGAVADSATAASSPGRGPSFSGAINSRDDVLKALTAIEDYYRRVEPTSPVPFALRRAKDWISLDFLSVLEDIAPGGLAEANKVLTSTRASSNGNGSGGGSSAAADDGWGTPSTTSDDGW